MFYSEKLNRSNIYKFKDLNEYARDFNPLNENAYNIYENHNNIFKKYVMSKEIYIFGNDKKESGFLWAKNSIVKSLFVKEDDKSILSLYKLINYKIKTSILYECKRAKNNFEILKSAGFHKYYDGLYELTLKINKPYIVQSNEDITLANYVKQKDTFKRLNLQNLIFDNCNRENLKIQNMIYDEKQAYFKESGALFIRYKNIDVGFGQIIYDSKIPSIVNFGIIPKYRGKGLAKYLLRKLINQVYEDGYNLVKLKVNRNNEKALNLYLNHNFMVSGEIFRFYYTH